MLVHLTDFNSYSSLSIRHKEMAKRNKDLGDVFKIMEATLRDHIDRTPRAELDAFKWQPEQATMEEKVVLVFFC